MELALVQPAKGVKKRRHQVTRPQLLTRDQLDKRTNAAKLFTKLVDNITADLGGAGELSTIELALIEAFVGATVQCEHFNAQIALGKSVNFDMHSQCIGAMCRVASRLGLSRRSRDVSPVDPLVYAREKS